MIHKWFIWTKWTSILLNVGHSYERKEDAKSVRTIIIPWHHVTLLLLLLPNVVTLLGPKKWSSSYNISNTTKTWSAERWNFSFGGIRENQISLICIIMCHVVVWESFIYQIRYKCLKTLFWYRILFNTSTIELMVRWHIFHISVWEKKWLFEIRHLIYGQAYFYVVKLKQWV